MADPSDSPGSRYQALLAADSLAVPEQLKNQSHPDLGTESLAAERYVSQEFFDREVALMWPRVWQMACREEEVSQPGDVVVYDIVGRSLLVLRDVQGRIRALHNSCLHRGRKILTESGHVAKLQCGFHGWAWSLDGQIQSLPCRWDFPQLKDADLRLPEARVATWGGFVFINFSATAPPLDEYLDVLPAHFQRWRLEDCWKAVHVAKRIPCNWKIAQEAFMESYHVIATHPQILRMFADADAQYDIYGDHVNRNLAAFGAPSPHLSRSPPSGTEVADAMLSMWAPGKTAADLERTGPELRPRASLAAYFRRKFAAAFGPSAGQGSDAEILDALVYNVFPNFSPWGGFAPNIVYRWRPEGMSPHACLMEVMILKRVPPGMQRPQPVAVHRLFDDEPWSAATELPVLGAVIDQDMSNMPWVHEGLRASATGRVHLARYQESRIRHFHRTLDRYLAGR